MSVEVPPLPLLPRSNTDSSSSDGGSKLRMRARLNWCWASTVLLSLDEDDDDLSLRLLNDGGEATDEEDRSAVLSSVSWRSLVSLLLSSSEVDDMVVDELGDVVKELADDNDDTSEDRVPSWLWLAVAVLVALVAVVLRSKFKDDLVAKSRRRYRRRMISLPSSLDSSSELLSGNCKRNDQNIQ